MVSVRGKVATGGEGVESVLEHCTVLRVCFECVSRVLRVCFKRQEASQALLTSSCSSINHPSRILQFLSDQSFSIYGVVLSWVLIKDLKRCSKADADQ